MVLFAKYLFIGLGVKLSGKVLIRLPEGGERTFLNYENRSHDCLSSVC